MKDPAYLRGLGERFGRLPASFQRTAQTSIWLHAVSVGEVLSCVELVRQMRRDMPWGAIYLSTTTLAGRKAAAEKLRDLVDGVFYAPVDYVFAVRAVLRRIRPLLVVVLETEIWPNLFRQAKLSGAGLVMLNARISPKTAATYARWRWFFEPVLNLPDCILAQSSESLANLRAAGAPPDSLALSGNIKYDFHPPPAPAGLQHWLTGPLWIAASTSQAEVAGDPDEDDAVIDAYRQLRTTHPALKLIIAPRRPERFPIVAKKLEAAGIPFHRRSSATGNGDVLLLDTIGELGSLFASADVVFMGGTLPHRGGHNILEPAFAGCAVISGPHLENFPEIAARFRAAGAILEIRTAEELAPAVDRLLRDRDLRKDLGHKARAQGEANRGATARAIQELIRVYDAAIPRAMPRWPLRGLLWILSKFWVWGSRRTPQPRRLATPVVSVGNLAVGGAGKTPLVRWLVRQAGGAPYVLTRGYKRRSTEILLLDAGQRAPAEMTGDEPQLILRDDVAGLAIGADRFVAGQAAEKRFRPTLFVMDDGFQHRRLYRDCDIVALDGLDPFAGMAAVPLGRLREEPSALRRAHAVVITRAEPGRHYHGVREIIRRYNAGAPVFLSRIVPEAWVPVSGGAELPPSGLLGETSGAFCGLANPASFWRTLDQLGYRPLFQREFPDHYLYSYADIRQLASGGASVLLTTEKDAANLPLNLAATVRIYALRIGIEVDGDLAKMIPQAVSQPSLS